MPWTIADVDSHKKGLTPAQKKLWVRTANDTLRRTGNEARAIRSANKVTGTVAKVRRERGRRGRRR